MAKLTPVTNQSGRIGQQVGAKASVQQVRAEEKRARALALEKARASSEKQKQQIQVDYESAWQEAKKHFNKGRAGAYIYHMKRDSSPKVQLVRSYLQQLVKQQRAGNISPTETGLAQVKRDIAREQAKISVGVEPGEYVYREIGTDKTTVLRDGKYVEVTQPIKYVAPEKPKTPISEEYLPPKERPTTGFKRFQQWFESKRGVASDGFLTPVTVKAGYDWGAEYTLRAGEFLGKPLEKVLPKDSFLRKPMYIPRISIPFTGIGFGGGNVTRGGVRSAISAGYMFTSLSPFMKTGTAQVQESAYVYDVKTGKFIKKADIKRYLELPKKDVAGKKVTIRGATFSEKATRIRDLLKSAKTPEARNLVLKTAQETYGKDFVKDFISQETGAYLPPKITTQTIPPKTTSVGGYTISAPPTIPRIDVILTGVKTSQDVFQPSQVGRTSWGGVSSMFSQSKSGQDVLQRSDTAQQTKQTTKVSQDFRTAQDVLQVSQTMQKMTTPQVTQQAPKLRSPFKSTFNFGQTQPVKKGLPLGLLWGRSRVLEKQVVRGNSWIPQVKSKGKWRTAGKRMDYNSALSRASEGADKSTARSIRVLPSKKKPQITGGIGWGMRKHKFRKGRKPNTFIEKSAYAIDTITEKRGLSFAKLSKQMNWGIPMKQTNKKKRRSKTNRKKRRKNYPWLV